ncbi:MerR family transcriptional regulator [Actinomycetota bacterium]
MESALTVGQVSEALGVTVRTLHHYDQIGLLRPSGRSAAGYRLYTEADLDRLQHVVVYRRLGFPLEEIAALLDAEGEELVGHLRRQRAAVMARLEEMHGLVEAIDNALEREMTGTPASHEDLKEIFGDGFNDDYQAEAEERWGDTDRWKQSQERSARRTKAEWAEIKAEADGINADFIAALEAGEPVDGERAMDIAERHRLGVERHYDCPHDFHRNLADMYLADPRFTAYFEDQRAGLAQYVHDAIHANADRN